MKSGVSKMLFLGLVLGVVMVYWFNPFGSTKGNCARYIDQACFAGAAEVVRVANGGEYVELRVREQKISMVHLAPELQEVLAEGDSIIKTCGRTDCLWIQKGNRKTMPFVNADDGDTNECSRLLSANPDLCDC